MIADTIMRLSEFLGVSVEWLITGHAPDGLTDEDRKLLASWHDLDTAAQNIILPIIENAAEKARQEKKNDATAS